jgi:hypothetical protein
MMIGSGHGMGQTRGVTDGSHLDLRVPESRGAGRLDPGKVGDDVGGVAVAGFEEVGADVQRGRRVGVAKPATDGADRDAGGEELGGVEVPQVLEADALEPRLLSHSGEATGDRVRVQGVGAVGPHL